MLLTFGDKRTQNQAVHQYCGRVSSKPLVSGYLEIGSIEMGKFADLVILNDNLFDLESDCLEDQTRGCVDGR